MRHKNNKIMIISPLVKEISQCVNIHRTLCSKIFLVFKKKKLILYYYTV